MFLAVPLLHRDLLHSQPVPLWKLITEIMFKCSAGPMGESRAFSHKQIISPLSVASKKKLWVKNHNQNQVNRTEPLQKGVNICHFFILQQELYDNSEDGCPIPLCSRGVVPHSAIRPYCIWISGLHSGSAVNKACPS